MKQGRLKQFWTFDNVSMVCVFLILAFILMQKSISSDTWWLLRSGKDILATKTVVLQDPYSYTVNGGYWPNHEWLSEIMLYLVYVVGGLFGLRLWLLLTVALLLLAVFSQMRGRVGMRALILMLAVWLDMPFWHIRPQTITFLLFSIGLLLLEHPRRWLYYPLLLFIWGNFHGGALVGGVIIFAAAIVALWRDRSHFWHWVGVGVVCLGLLLANPMGYHVLTYALNSLSSSTTVIIEEWEPASFSNPSGRMFLLALGVFIGCVIYLRKHLTTHREWTFVLVGVITGLMAARSVRHIPLFTLAAFPVITWALARFVPERSVAVKPAQRLLLQALVGILCLGVVIKIAQTPTKLPVEEANLRALAACPGNIYNTYDDGGPLIWLLPEKLVMVDNRFDPYPVELVKAGERANRGMGYEELFAQYSIQCALVPTDAPLLAQLQAAGWHELNVGELHAVLQRP